MNKRISSILVCAVMIGVVSLGLTHTVRGEEASNIITDDQIAAIKMNCTGLQANLNRLLQSDKLLRIDRGNLYRLISSRLMVPLNQRIASNQLDGGNLVQLTASYNTAYQTFFNAYKDYETSLSAALAIDCTRQPTTFYDQVADARTKRQALHAASAKLVDLAAQYKSSFLEFRKTANLSTEASE